MGLPTHTNASRHARSIPVRRRRFVQRAEQVLRRAGWQGELFLGVKLVDPTWTRARWKQAQATLAQWQQRQGRARGQGSGLEPLGDAPYEVSESEED